MKINHHPLMAEAEKLKALSGQLFERAASLERYVRDTWTNPDVWCGISEIQVRPNDIVITVTASDPMTQYDWYGQKIRELGTRYEFRASRGGWWQQQIGLREGEWSEPFGGILTLKVDPPHANIEVYYPWRWFNMADRPPTCVKFVQGALSTFEPCES